MPRSLPERVINFSVHHAPWVVIATFAATIVFAWFAVKVRINPDFVSFLPQNAEVSRIMKEYSGTTESMDVLVVAVAADSSGGDVFAPDRLSAFSEAVNAISAQPDILSVVSPFNLVSFGRENGRLAIRPMSTGGAAPAAAEIPDFRARLAEAPYAKNLVISTDGTMLIAYFQAKHKSSFQDLMKAVDTVTAGLRAKRLSPYVTGLVPGNVQVSFYLTRDLTRLLLLAALIIILCYAASFRTLSGVFLPLISVVFGTLWTVGFMGMMGYSLSLVSVVAPPLIMIFGNEYNIYSSSELQRLGRAEGAPPGWIEQASHNVAKPLIMAFLSTVVGFLSLCVTEINATREFAIATSFGSLACAFLALFFLPAMFALLKPSAPHRRIRGETFPRAMRAVALFTQRFPAVVLAATAAVIALFALTWPKLIFNTDAGNFYPQNDRVLRDTYAIYAKAGGYEQLFVSFDAPNAAPGFFLDAGALAKVEKVERALRANPDITYAISLPDLLRRINIAATGRDELPTNRAVISMFSRLLAAAGGSSASGSVLGNLVNKDFTRITLSFRIYNAETGRYMGEVRFRSLLASMRKTLEENPIGAKPVIWGDLMRILFFTESLRRSLFLSIAISTLLILVLTVFVFRSFLHGAYALVPLAQGILLNFSLMALLHIPMDVTTIMVSTIAIGIGVDGAIYLVIQFKRETARFPADPSLALQETLAVIGRPVLISSLSIVAGLLVFLTAAFRPIMYFGLLVMFTLLATAGGTLVTLPTLLGIDSRIRLRRLRGKESSRASA
ncbi:MAG: MMPL family transporter [Spirochaetia bacterium]|jgi:predicted RND superfamily exporter protein